MKNIRLWMLLGSIFFFSATATMAFPLTPPQEEQTAKKEQEVRKFQKGWTFFGKKKQKVKEDEKSFPWLSAFALFFGLAWIAFMALQVYFFSFYWSFALLSAVAAILLGIFGLKTESYKKMAIAGIVLGVVGLVGGLMYLFTAVLMI